MFTFYCWKRSDALQNGPWLSEVQFTLKFHFTLFNHQVAPTFLDLIPENKAAMTGHHGLLLKKNIVFTPGIPRNPSITATTSRGRILSPEEPIFFFLLSTPGNNFFMFSHIFISPLCVSVPGLAYSSNTPGISPSFCNPVQVHSLWGGKADLFFGLRSSHPPLHCKSSLSLLVRTVGCFCETPTPTISLALLSISTLQCMNFISTFWETTRAADGV